MRKRKQEREGEKPDPTRLIQCADLILTYLHPPDLSATSSTCKSLHNICKSITAVRSSDATRGIETVTVPFINLVDSQPYVYFTYLSTRTRILDPTHFRIPWPTLISKTSNSRSSKPDPTNSHSRGYKSGVVDPDMEFGCGCDCGSFCGDECPCGELSWGELTRECGPSCRCETGCWTRVTQGGIAVKVKVVKDGRKGWGLVAAQGIPRGQFVCEYAGELLTTKEARRRQQKYDQLSSSGRFASALLVVREHLPSRKAYIRINIDATLIGNVARFINHSCDGGNLSTVLVRSSGALLPRLCFFASRDIRENEELSFSYGETRVQSNGLQCFCGSSCCFGRLPSENT